MSEMRILSIGEILWGVFPEQELLGGAALNFTINSHRLGHSGSLFTAVGNDERGRSACAAMTASGLSTEFVQHVEIYSTGTAKIETNSAGEPQFVIRRPAAFDCVTLTEELFARLRSNDFDWLYFGTLMQTGGRIEAITTKLTQLSTKLRCFYDVNLRSGHWNFSLIQRLCQLASIMKLNEDEAQILSQLNGVPPDAFSLDEFCAKWSSLYDLDLVCVTRGSEGCYIYGHGSGVHVTARPVIVHDTVGAGDAFAAGFLHGLDRGWPTEQIAHFANALGSIVASRPGATPHWSAEECLAAADEWSAAFHG
jgi:fructokinase